MRVLLSAGEASGDNYGAMLIRQLRATLGEGATFYGVGGEQMRLAGFDTVVDSNRLAAVGITEVIRHIPTIYREFYRLVGVARERRPDVAVLIDFPDFNLRLAEKLHRLGVPVVYFVSPQLWAWKQHRIRRVRRFVDEMLVIFPFEEAYYRERGVNARYVGHPLADLPLPAATREEFAREYQLDAGKPWIALLPGSRKREVLLNLPVMLEAAGELGSGFEYVLPVASTLSKEWLQQRIAASAVRMHLVKDARLALAHARASVVASGTATVEAALIGNPFLVVYRVSRLTYAIGRRLVKVSNFGMVNLIAGREIVPELIQQNFSAQNVVARLRPLLQETEERRTMQRELLEVRRRLHVEQDSHPTAVARAAAVVAEILNRGQAISPAKTY